MVGLGTAWILDGLEVTIVGSVASRLTENGSGISITSAGIGEAAAIYVVGACLGALVFGHLTDRFGRKRLFLITLALYMLATAITAVSFSAWFFFVFRFFTGAGIGGEYAAINSAIDELIPARARGRIDLVINGSYWIGSIMGSALAIFFLDEALFPADIGWRFTFVLGIVIASAVMVVRRHVPESPRWLFIHGREEEAEALVDRIEAEVAESTGAPLEPATRTLVVHQRRTIGFRSIVRTAVKDYPTRSVLCIALFVGQAFIYNGITFDLGTLMSKFFHVAAGVTPVFLILYAAANFLGPLLLGRLFDTVGRIPMITGTYLGSAVLGLVLAGVFAETGILNRWGFIAVVMLTFFLASAGASAAYLTSSEIFPMETRALAIAFFYAIGTAAGGVLGPLLFGPLITTGNKSLVALAFFIGSVLMAAGAAAELAFGVKAEQQQLEDIARPLTAGDVREGATAPGEAVAGAVTAVQAAAARDHQLAAYFRAEAEEQRASAAEHRARLHELLSRPEGRDGTHIELEGTLALVADARALAHDERAGAAEARAARRALMGGARLREDVEGGSEREPTLERERAADFRALSHEHEAQALLAADDREAGWHRQLGSAALERARAAEQSASAAETTAPQKEPQTDQGHAHGLGEGGAPGAEETVRATLSAMHASWSDMHDHRAAGIELSAAGRHRAAAAHDREADAAAERARALSFLVEAAEHRARALDVRAEASAQSVPPIDPWARVSRAQARQDDARARTSLERYRSRELSGMRRFRPGPGRLAPAPGAPRAAPPPAEEALDHEILSIERALYDHGPADRRELARMVGATYWGPGAFAEALRQAVNEGLVRRLSRRVYAPVVAEEPDATGDR